MFLVLNDEKVTRTQAKPLGLKWILSSNNTYTQLEK